MAVPERAGSRSVDQRHAAVRVCEWPRSRQIGDDRLTHVAALVDVSRDLVSQA